LSVEEEIMGRTTYGTKQLGSGALTLLPENQLQHVSEKNDKLAKEDKIMKTIIDRVVLDTSCISGCSPSTYGGAQYSTTEVLLDEIEA
jgi:hypothetical protein